MNDGDGEASLAEVFQDVDGVGAARASELAALAEERTLPNSRVDDIVAEIDEVEELLDSDRSYSMQESFIREQLNAVRELLQEAGGE